MALMDRIAREAGHLRFNLAHFLTTQDHDLEFYVQLEKVETATTDWLAMAKLAEKNALWPGRTPHPNVVRTVSSMLDKIPWAKRAARKLMRR
jgi:hypothetical protein